MVGGAKRTEVAEQWAQQMTSSFTSILDSDDEELPPTKAGKANPAPAAAQAGPKARPSRGPPGTAAGASVVLSDDSDESDLGATFDRAANAHARTSLANANPRTAAAAKDKAPSQSPDDEQRRKRAAMRRAEFLAQSVHDRTAEPETRGPAPGVQAAGAAPEPAAADVARKSASPPPASMSISTSFPGDFVPSGGASAHHSPPSPMQTSAWRLRTHAMMLGGEVHAPPKPETGSNLIVESRISLHPVEQPPEYPEQMAASPRPQGNLLKSAGDQAIKDGSGAVDAALSSVISTFGFIGDGLRSAARAPSAAASGLHRVGSANNRRLGNSSETAPYGITWHIQRGDTPRAMQATKDSPSHSTALPRQTDDNLLYTHARNSEDPLGLYDTNGTTSTNNTFDTFSQQHYAPERADGAGGMYSRGSVGPYDTNGAQMTIKPLDVSGEGIASGILARGSPVPMPSPRGSGMSSFVPRPVSLKRPMPSPRASSARSASSGGENNDSKVNAWQQQQDKNTLTPLAQAKVLVDSAGSDPGQLLNPKGLVLDTSGNIVIADSGNHRIQVFTEAGVFVRSFGKFGDGPAEFNFPWGVAMDRNSGNIVVSDTHNHRIQVFSQHGIFLKAFGQYGAARGQLCFPHGIAVSTNGDIIVADTLNHRICLFSGLSSSWQGGGKLLKTFTGTTQMNPAASSMPVHVTFSYPLGVAVSGTGDIVVSDWKANRVEWLNQSAADAGPKMSIGGSGRQEGQFDAPSALAFDDRDNLLVCDFGNQRVQVLKKSGVFLRAYGCLELVEGAHTAGIILQLTNPVGVAAGSAGNTLVSDSEHCAILSIVA